MDIQELAERSGIPVRRLRHCLDEGLVPGLELETAVIEIGRRRKFSDDAGFGLCCAATLVAAGVDRSLVRVFLGGLAKVTFRNTDKSVIATAFERRAEGIAELGDHVNVRIRLKLRGAGSSSEGQYDYDSGWVDLANCARLSPGYEPLSWIGLDLGQIGSAVFKWDELD